MAEIVNKTELVQPFELDYTNPITAVLDTVHVFANSGVVGTQPAVLTDVMGNNDINMTWGTAGGVTGGLIGDGALRLYDHGNAQTNDWGIFANAVTDTSGSKIMHVSFIHRDTPTINWEHILKAFGFVIWYSKSTSELQIRHFSSNSHGTDLKLPISTFPVGTVLNIVMQVNKIAGVFNIAINGVDYTSSLIMSGNYFAASNSNIDAFKYIGRTASWDNNYGYNGHINSIAFGYNFNGRELTLQQVIDASNQMYPMLTKESAPSTEYCISLPTTNDKVTIPLSGAYTGTTELSDGTQTPISGTGTYTIDGTVAQRIKKITVTDTNGLHVYYFDLTEPQYSVNKVVNGTFDTDTNWLKTGGCTISGSVGHVDGTGSASLLYQSMLVQGRKYKVEFDVTNHVAGTTVVWNNDGTTLYTITGNGHVSFTFTHAIANGNFIFRANAASYDVDNVVVQEVVVNSLTSNLAANLAGSPVFEVIVPVVEVSVGVGKTYATGIAAFNARRNLGANVLQDLVIYDFNVGKVESNCDMTNTRIRLRGAAQWDMKSVPLYGMQNIRVNSTVVNTPLIPIYLQDLYMDGGSSVTISQYYWSNTAAYDLTRLDIVGTSSAIGGSAYNTPTSNIYNVDGRDLRINVDGAVLYITESSHLCRNARVNLNNILAIKSGSGVNYNYSFAALKSYNQSVNVTNAIVNHTGNYSGNSGFARDGLVFSNLVTNVPSTSLSTAVATDCIFDTDVTQYFDVNGFISQTGQTALAGKGWNGSDLLKEFWAEATANINITQVLTGSGSLQLQIETQRLLSSILNGTGDLTSIVETLKSIGVNTSTIADIVSVLESSKSINSSASGSGNISTAIEIIRMLSSTITSTGDLIVALEVLRLLDSAVTGGSDLTSIALHALRSLDIIVEGAGSLVSTVTKESLTEALVTLILTGGGSISTNIFSNKLSDSTITTESNIYTLYNKTGNITSGSTAAGDILASLSTVKSSDSNVSALGGVLVFLEKDVLTAVSITGSGISSEVFQTDKLSGNLVISGGGPTISVSVKDIASITNVVFVELSATASKYNISMDIYAENSNIGINTNASN